MTTPLWERMLPLMTFALGFVADSIVRRNEQRRSQQNELRRRAHDAFRRLSEELLTSIIPTLKTRDDLASSNHAWLRSVAVAGVDLPDGLVTEHVIAFTSLLQQLVARENPDPSARDEVARYGMELWEELRAARQSKEWQGRMAWPESQSTAG